jgi:hypothetical protein
MAATSEDAEQRAGAFAVPSDWVLVPVPEEHVEEVYRFIFSLHLRSSDSWSAERATAALDEMDDLQRELVERVAAGASSSGFVLAGDLARELGISERELYGLVREIHLLPTPRVSGPIVLDWPGPNPRLFMQAATAALFAPAGGGTARPPGDG